MDYLLSGVWGGLSLAVLPCLPALIVFNVADDLGNRRILSRLLLFPAGVFGIIILSILAIEEFPVILLYATYLDVIWGLIVVWLGYAVLRKRGTFIIRAARENFLAWCYGTFLMGMIFGSLWINYFSTFDLAVLEIYNNIYFAVGLSTTLSYAALYALGLALSAAGVGLATYVLSRLLGGFLPHHRAAVKAVSGGIIMLAGAYLIYSDVFFALRYSGYL